MSVPLRYLLKFLSASAILMALWPPVTWIYGPLLGSATNAFFAFFQPGISLEVGEKTYFVCNLWPDTVRSELKSFGTIYLNALVVIALFAGLPGKLKGRLKALGTALIALFGTHVLCIYLLSHFAVWNALQSMNQTLQIQGGSFLPLSDRIATALFHQKAMLCSKIMVLWGNFGWEGFPFLAGALFYIRSRGLLQSPGAERVSRPPFKRERVRNALKKPTSPRRTGSPSPPASRPASRAIRRNVMYSVLIMLPFTSVTAQAQIQVFEVTPAQGISGENNVLPGNEIQIYVLHIEDTVNDVRSARLGDNPPGSFGITVTISDVSGGGSGLAASDLIGLNLYRSDDATLDAGDTFMKTVAASIVAATLIDMQGVAGGDRDIPDPGDVPSSIYFFVTADVSAGATPGHRFRLAAALDHADIRESGGGPPSSYGVGSPIAASDANVVIIVAAGGGGPPEVPRTIPLMPPYLYVVLAIIIMGYGIFSLKARH